MDWFLRFRLANFAAKIFRFNVAGQRTFFLGRTAGRILLVVLGSLLADFGHSGIPVAGSNIRTFDASCDVKGDAVWIWGADFGDSSDFFGIGLRVPPALHRVADAVPNVWVCMLNTIVDLFDHVVIRTKVQ